MSDNIRKLGGITTPSKLIEKYKTDEKRAVENQQIFYGELPAEIYRDAGQPPKVRTVDEAIGRLVYDFGWYSGYRIEVVVECLRRSAYEEGEDYTQREVVDCLKAAEKSQSGYYGCPENTY